MPKSMHTLLATLGGQPQVVTFTLDLLLQRGFPISEVIVIHPDPVDPRLQHSLAHLSAEFIGNRYGSGETCIRLRSQVLQLNQEPLADIVDEESAEGALDTIHQLISNLKRQYHSVHLSMTGGRRLMSSIAIEAAFLNFTSTDHIWHIYTPADIQLQANEGALMHVMPVELVHLIERPFVPWATYFTTLPQAVASAQEVRQQQQRAMSAQERARCQQVIRKLSGRKLEVLRAFAEGCTIQEVADRLSISPRTVDGHKTQLLELCREAWGLDEHAPRSGYHYLYKTFAPYFASEQS